MNQIALTTSLKESRSKGKKEREKKCANHTFDPYCATIIPDFRVPA